MTTSRAEALLRKPEQPRRATFLELFFDLVFAFSLGPVAHRLTEAFATPGRDVPSEAGQTLLLLLALVMVWFITSWITDLYDPQRVEIQLLVIASMFGILVMGIAVPEAYDGRAVIFAGAYVAIHLSRGLVIVPTLKGHEAQRRAAGAILWYAVSAVPWIVGAVLPQTAAREALWALALAVEYTGAMLLFPGPWRRHAHMSEWPVVGEYLSDRYQQFFIIALGELILITATTYGSIRISAATTAAFVVSFATTVLLWRTYTYRAGQALSSAIEAAGEPTRLVRQALSAHLLMVAGIVVIAVGYELVIAHPLGRAVATWGVVIFGGPILFLIGRALFGYAIFGSILLARPIGAAVLAVAAFAMASLPPLAAAAAAALVLAAVAVLDAVRLGRLPEQPSPRR
jgi:low temperature requirement protein LtrA